MSFTDPTLKAPIAPYKNIPHSQWPLINTLSLKLNIPSIFRKTRGSTENKWPRRERETFEKCKKTFNFKRGYLALIKINFSIFNSPSRTHINLLVKILILGVHSNHSSQKGLISTGACPYFVSILELEVVVQRCYVKKMFLKLSPCQNLFFKRLQTSAVLLKKRIWHRPFPVNFAKYLRMPFL